MVRGGNIHDGVNAVNSEEGECGTMLRAIPFASKSAYDLANRPQEYAEFPPRN